MFNPTTRVINEPSAVLDLGSQIGRFTIDTSSFLNLSSEACSPSFLSNFLYFNNVAARAAPKRTVSLSLKLGGGGGGYRFRNFIHDFNRAIRFHCERIPIGFASLRLGDGNGDGNDGNGNGEGVGGNGNGTVVEDDGLKLNGSDCVKPKKVLILMSDTGGGHRASAEAIKAAFYEEYGDNYQVLFI
jgi:1,2-diacylglycerol 3-beta-galactosyltransferase